LRFSRWRGDGKELFFLAPDNRLMATPVRLAPQDDAAEIGAPVPLFAVTSPITLVLNWKPQP